MQILLTRYKDNMIKQQTDLLAVQTMIPNYVKPTKDQAVQATPETRSASTEPDHNNLFSDMMRVKEQAAINQIVEQGDDYN